MPIIRRNRPLNHGDQLFRRRQRMAFTRMNNGTRDSPGKPFFAELKNRVGQLCLRPSIDQVSCRPAYRLIHSHVQRTFPLKAKPASRFFQLCGRDPKVKQGSIDLGNAIDSKMLLQVHKMTMDKDHTVSESCEPLVAGCNGLSIAVKPDKPAIRTTCFQELFSMPTVSHRTIKISSPTLSSEPKHHLFCHNWDMSGNLHKLLKTKFTHFLPLRRAVYTHSKTCQ